MSYLGALISKKRYSIDPKKFQGRPRPTTELVGYFHQYVPNFSKRANLFNNLLKKQKQSKKSRVSMKTLPWNKTHENALEWTDELFDISTIVCIPQLSATVYVAYRYIKRGFRLGCVLYQIQEGMLRTLSVGSRILSDAASKHHIAPTIFSLEMGNLSLFLRLFEMICAIW